MQNILSFNNFTSTFTSIAITKEKEKDIFARKCLLNLLIMDDVKEKLNLEKKCLANAIIQIDSSEKFSHMRKKLGFNFIESFFSKLV